MPKKPKKDKQQLFEETCRRMEEEGYRRTDLTISAKQLNLIALLVIVPMIGIPCILFMLRWNLLAESGVAIEVSAWTLVAFFAGVVVHELIHGLVWSFFCKDGLHSIHFGFQLKTLTPYCHCAQPLDKGGYIAGTLAPGAVLGLLPILLSLVLPNVNLMLFGAMSLAVAVGGLCHRAAAGAAAGGAGGRPPHRSGAGRLFKGIKKGRQTPPFFACGLIG